MRIKSTDLLEKIQDITKYFTQECNECHKIITPFIVIKNGELFVENDYTVVECRSGKNNQFKHTKILCNQCYLKSNK